MGNLGNANQWGNFAFGGPKYAVSREGKGGEKFADFSECPLWMVHMSIPLVKS